MLGSFSHQIARGRPILIGLNRLHVLRLFGCLFPVMLPGMTNRLRRWAKPLIGLMLFVVALLVLDQQLRHYSFADVLAHTRSIPLRSIVLVVLCTAASYLATTMYDLIALRHLGHSLRSAGRR